METWEELKPTVDEQIATKFQSPVLRCARALRCYVALLTHCPCPFVSGNTVLTHAQEELDPPAASCSGRARGAWLCRVEPGLACSTLLTSPSFLQRANSFDKETSVAAWKLFRELVKTAAKSVLHKPTLRTFAARTAIIHRSTFFLGRLLYRRAWVQHTSLEKQQLQNHGPTAPATSQFEPCPGRGYRAPGSRAARSTSATPQVITPVSPFAQPPHQSQQRARQSDSHGTSDRACPWPSQQHPRAVAHTKTARLDGEEETPAWSHGASQAPEWLCCKA